MVIPKCYNEFFPAFSNCLSDGAAHTLEEILEYYADSFNLRREDRSATLENVHDLQVSREKGALSLNLEIFISIDDNGVHNMKNFEQIFETYSLRTQRKVL